MSEKLTREQIEKFRTGLRNECDDDGTREAFDALCDLALAGLEVQRHPKIGDMVTIVRCDLAAEWRGETPEIVGITKGKDGAVTYTLKDGAGCLSDLWPESDFAIYSLPEPK